MQTRREDQALRKDEARREEQARVVAVAAVKDAPGVSTLALAMAAGWPAAGVVLVEADPHGGDLAARFGHHPQPGLVTLAAALARAGTDPVVLGGHVQRLRLGVDVVLAPPGDATAAVRTLAQDRGLLLRRHAAGAAVLVDVGRLVPHGPGLAVAAVATDVVLVARPRLDQLAQLQARLAGLREAVTGRLWLALAGPGPYPPGEVSAAFGVEVLGAVPRGDRLGVGVLTGRLAGPGWRRLRLPRAGAALAATLATAPEPTPTAAAVVGPRPGRVGR